MQPSVAIDLIKEGVAKSNGLWADLGCGNGVFTNALLSLLGSESTIFAVDKDAASLSRLNVTSNVTPVHADFARDDLSLPPLNGILLANSLHFIHDPGALILKLHTMLSPSGRVIIIEYETEISNEWIPNPIPFKRLPELFQENGFSGLRMLHSIHPHL